MASASLRCFPLDLYHHIKYMSSITYITIFLSEDALVGAIVASFVAAAVSAYAQTPTAADFAVCNADAQVAVKAGTTTPTTKD